ncbi:16S rRNA (cytidine(1402)-2'-O)-methyltransferase [Candidatus Peregrinibacteria bacterium]|nr:16S rRNA (cytidine(1402)-2'-O)-methyltransferase [Candidatus Peregrinibacteria bacterium]
MLYIVATPIGNLEDITFRAVNVLKSVDLIAAEDTRHAGILLKKYEITTPVKSFHAHSDERRLNEMISYMREGKSVALISDAGTPGISDPGYVLIRRAIEEGFKVVPIPGPAAFLTALMAGGAPTNQFLYLGFIPAKKGRQKFFTPFFDTKHTIVFYESPHRLLKTLGQMAELMPKRNIVVARELTKIYEEFYRGTAEQALEHFSGAKIKGEFVIVVGPDGHQ